MGKVVSSLANRATRFNIENRTHKFLDKKQKITAPKYEGNVKDYERVLQEIPDIVEKLNKKDSGLDSRLKQVYVTSEDKMVVPDPEKINLNRPLPSDTKRTIDFEFGHKEPVNIARGKVTLKQAIQFISDHQSDPKSWSMPKICDTYNLKPEHVFNVLEYFSTFKLHIPDKRTPDKMIAEAVGSKQKQLK